LLQNTYALVTQPAKPRQCNDQREVAKLVVPAKRKADATYIEWSYPSEYILSGQGMEQSHLRHTCLTAHTSLQPQGPVDTLKVGHCFQCHGAIDLGIHAVLDMHIKCTCPAATLIHLDAQDSPNTAFLYEVKHTCACLHHIVRQKNKYTLALFHHILAVSWGTISPSGPAGETDMALSAIVKLPISPARSRLIQDELSGRVQGEKRAWEAGCMLCIRIALSSGV